MHWLLEGEEYLLIVYGIYYGKELAHASYIDEKSLEKHLRELVENIKDIVREYSRLKHPQIVAEKLTNIIRKESEESM